MSRPLVAVLVGMALAGCAAAPARDRASNAAELPVFYGPPPKGKSFTGAERLWVDSLSTVFYYSGHRTEPDGMLALKAAAIDRGANALHNPVCGSDPGAWGGAKWYCYGTVVRIE